MHRGRGAHQIHRPWSGKAPTLTKLVTPHSLRHSWKVGEEEGVTPSYQPSQKDQTVNRHISDLPCQPPPQKEGPGKVNQRSENRRFCLSVRVGGTQRASHGHLRAPRSCLAPRSNTCPTGAPTWTSSVSFPLASESICCAHLAEGRQRQELQHEATSHLERTIDPGFRFVKSP